MMRKLPIVCVLINNPPLLVFPQRYIAADDYEKMMLNHRSTAAGASAEWPIIIISTKRCWRNYGSPKTTSDGECSPFSSGCGSSDVSVLAVML